MKKFYSRHEWEIKCLGIISASMLILVYGMWQIERMARFGGGAW